MTTTTPFSLIHPQQFTKFVLRQMIPAFSKFNEKNVVTIRNHEGIIGYTMKTNIAITMDWSLQRLREFIALFATLSADYPNAVSLSPDDITIPNIVPNRIFEFLQLPKPAIVDSITPEGGNPLQAVYREISTLVIVWEYCCDLCNKGVAWLEKAYDQAYQHELTMAMVADFDMISVQGNASQVNDSDVVMTYVGYPLEDRPSIPAVPPPSPSTSISSDESGEGMALVVHPTASAYAHAHPGYNPFVGDLVRDVNA
ncbi:hypothetical protein CVT24_012227 [Panaeolus cyanescens]|uniref:Uncharacterized protein n=1 Tax=Panaeolus cyanescens TaxID=181874 RepID=A0A409YYR8_9AGAR|nr:hypothetical protein CVT24_012227 [Panaeolus cyanescens]